MQEIFDLFVKTYGLIGVFLALPIISSIVLWRDNKSLQLEIRKSQKEVVDSQKQRVTDAQMVSSKLIELVSEQASLNKETILSLDRISDTLTGLKLHKE